MDAIYNENGFFVTMYCFLSTFEIYGVINFEIFGHFGLLIYD